MRNSRSLSNGILKAFGLFMLALPIVVNAGTNYWSSAFAGGSWSVSLDNGVIYVQSATMPSHCLYQRAQIDTSIAIGSASATYQRDLYAFVLASYAASKPLRIVVNDGDTICKITGASN